MVKLVLSQSLRENYLRMGDHESLIATITLQDKGKGTLYSASSHLIHSFRQLLVMPVVEQIFFLFVD